MKSVLYSNLGFLFMFRFSYLLISLLIVTGCPDPDAAGVGSGEAECDADHDCAIGQMCMSGVCTLQVGDPWEDLNPSEPDAGIGDEQAEDAGNAQAPAARLEASESEIEFGGQRLGIPVTREVTITNTGTLAVTLVAADLVEENGADGQNEFSMNPVGVIDEVLYPGSEKTFEITHTPVDGLVDAGQIRLIHTGPEELLTVELLAEFKGNPDVLITETLAEDAEVIDSFYVGATTEFGASVTNTFWVRNQGSLDSVLSLTDVQIVPDNVGFSLENAFDGAQALGAWDAGLCVAPELGEGTDGGVVSWSDDDSEVNCPPGGIACLNFDGVGACADENDVPIYAFPVTVHYNPVDATASATLSIVHNSGGNADTQSNIELLATAPGCPANADFNFEEEEPECECNENYYDLNEDLNGPGSDGCEYNCVFVSDDDSPDDLGIDANCDGMDGMRATGLFVDSDGSDLNNGSMLLPVATLKRALQLALVNDAIDSIFIAGGTYFVDEQIHLINGVNLYGGYQGSFSSRNEDNAVFIGETTTLFHIANISSALRIERLDLVTDDRSSSVDGPGAYTATLVIENSSESVTLYRVNVEAGQGAAGQNMLNGNDGAAGAAGSPGSGSTGGCGGAPNGGRGGDGRNQNSGLPGACGGTCGAVTNTCAAYDSNDPCAADEAGGGAGNGENLGCGDGNPKKGADGANGACSPNGSHGEGGEGDGFFDELTWSPGSGSEGTVGVTGSGGGGGGAGGGEDCVVIWCVHCNTGRGGGGGGGGGAGGMGGAGGTGGGASIGVLMDNATLILNQVEIRTNDGGQGGQGGAGGLGGTGGAGGTGQDNNGNDEQGSGGHGGNGSAGGTGGCGGGGPGGPSVGIWGLDNVIVSTGTGVIFQTGDGGPGASAKVRNVNGSNICAGAHGGATGASENMRGVTAF